jgi:hypothetical protein
MAKLLLNRDLGEWAIPESLALHDLQCLGTDPSMAAQYPVP